MPSVQKMIQELKADGFSDAAILDALCDGEALERYGITDADQPDTEGAYSSLRRGAISAYMAEIGSKGGKAPKPTSAANGRLGGRPKKAPSRD